MPEVHLIEYAFRCVCAVSRDDNRKYAELRYTCDIGEWREAKRARGGLNALPRVANG